MLGFFGNTIFYVFLKYRTLRDFSKSWRNTFSGKKRVSDEIITTDSLKIITTQTISTHLDTVSLKEPERRLYAHDQRRHDGDGHDAGQRRNEH